MLLSPFQLIAAQDLTISVFLAEKVEFTEIGEINVENLGMVSFTASKSGNQIFVRAIGPDGNLVGRSESVAGLEETPIYIKVSDGLTKIRLKWVKNKD